MERIHDIGRLALRFAAIVGFSLCASLLVWTIVFDDAVERAAQSFTQYRIEREVREQLGRDTAGNVQQALGALKDRYQTELAAANRALNEDVPRKVADAIAALCRLDCKKRKALQQSIGDGYRDQSSAAQQKIATLNRFIEGRYLEIITNLTRDVRIFLGSNALLFAFVFLLAWVKPRASLQLYLPGGVLLVSTLASAAIYIFGQNWFFTLLHNDFIGFAYLGYGGVLFAFLCDIAFNKARITSNVLNAIFNVIGAAMHAAPC
jgi:hypothetical protein